ncbi:MAG: hypothetical protein J7L39_03925 [Candidatus Aenigmarchaeota archaeon]|nr:hypothetical protein [Candidatus Aenigmarchaeota archaeon]
MNEEELKERYEVEGDEIPERPVDEGVEEEVVKEKEEKKEEEINLPELLLRIERIEGRIEALDGFNKDLQERFLQLSQDIGELRSMLLERDRTIENLETEVEKTSGMLSFIDLDKVRKLLEKKDVEIEELKANLERLEEAIGVLRKEMKDIEDLVDKIKSFESLVELSRRLSEKISKLEDMKSYVTKMVGKVETMFLEINDKVAELSAQKDKVDKLDELIMEIVKSLDEVSSKLPDFIKREEMEKILEKEIEDKIEKLVKGKVETITKLSSEIKEVKEKSLEVLEKTSLQLRELSEIIKKKSKVWDLNIRFLIGLEYLISSEGEERRRAIEKLKSIVREMKEIGIWNETKKRILDGVISIVVEGR